MSTDVTSLSNTTALKSSAATSKVGGDDVTGKVEFLNLLVAQLENQDPLNPDEGTEFATQLAQFSSLEQLMNLNASTQLLLQSNLNSDNIALLSTIGKDVLYYGEAFAYEGGEVDMGYVLGGDATDVTVEIKRDGKVIRTITPEDYEAGIHNFTWDGLDDNGKPALAGDYTVAVSANKSGTEVTSATLLKGTVESVNLAGGSASLTTHLGEIGSYSQIIGIYDKDNNDSVGNGGAGGDIGTDESDKDESDKEDAESKIFRL